MYFQLIVIYLGLIANLILQNLDANTNNLYINATCYKYNFSLETIMVVNKIIHF